jgi:hypothetical protein
LAANVFQHAFFGAPERDSRRARSNFSLWFGLRSNTVNRRLTSALTLAAGIMAAASAAALPVTPHGTTRVVALSGSPAPGGGRYTFFYEPVINNQGQVAYSAWLEGIGAGTPIGVFRSDGSSTTLVAGPGSPGTFQLQHAGQPALNDAGVVTFHGTSIGGPALVLRGSGGPLTEIARAGQTAPGGGTFAYLPIDPRINDGGQVAFAVSFNPLTGETGGVYRGSGGAITEIARLGRPAPSGGNYSAFHWALPINNLGEVAFAASTTGGSTGGIFRGLGATTVKIARQGDPAPDGAGVFAHLGGRTPALNNLGQVAFLGNVDPPLGPRYEGVFRGSGGTVTEIVRAGETTSGGERFVSFAHGPVINDRGETAFAAFLEDAANPSENRMAIYRAEESTLIEAMREGALAPDGNGRFLDFGNPELSGRGHLGVMAKLSETSGGLLDDEGLYFFADAAGLVQVARKGQPMLGSTIASLSFTGGLNHVESTGDDATGINDRGELAFAFQLADGRRGVAVWQVPEPATGAMLAAGLALVGVHRRRRALVARCR